MHEELKKLRIEKHERAAHRERSRWPWLLLLLLAGGGGAYAWQSARKAPPVVEIIRVHVPEGTSNEAQRVGLNATGYIVAAHKIELASKVIGRVAWVGVEMGDKIKAGEVLVRLEDDEYRARVAQEQGQLDNASAKLAELKAGSRPQETASVAATLDKSVSELEIAKKSFKRLADLQNTNAVSRQQIDDAEALVAAREAQVNVDRQQLELSKVGPRKEQISAQEGTVRQLQGSLALAMVDLDNTVIHSPLDATVLERNVELGEFVTNGFVGDRGAKGYVVSIADLNDLRVDLDVSQNDFAKVSSRQPCWIVTDAYPDQRYDGYVDLISPEANRQKATIQVRVKISKPDDRLRPDMNATVSFLRKQVDTGSASTTLPDSKPAAISLPATAVLDGSVFVVESGKAQKRAVTIGQTLPTGEVEVRSGLIGGEDVIISPPARLNDGDPVTVHAATTEPN